MPRDPISTLNNLQFTRSALLSGQRLDSRPLDAYRPLSISFPSPSSLSTSQTTSVTVKLGTTHLLTTISSNITPPHPNRPLEGTLSIQPHFTPLTSPTYNPRQPSSTSSSLAHTLDKMFRHSNNLDLESLVLVPGQAAWHIRADIHVLVDDGGVSECAILGVLGGLVRHKLPYVDVKGGRVGRAWGLDEKEGVNLGVLGWCAGVEWSFLRRSKEETAVSQNSAQEQEEGTVIRFADATAAEQLVRDGSVLVVANRNGDVLSVSKSGGQDVDARTLVGWVRSSVEKVRWMEGVLKEALERAEEVAIRQRGVREGRAVEERL